MPPETATTALPLIQSPAGVLAALASVGAFFFWLQRTTRWRLFDYLPPLIYIYLVPVLLSNLPAVQGRAVLPTESAVYDALGALVLPLMLVLLLMNVDVGGALRVLGRGVGVMLFGTLGVVIGAPLGLLAVRGWIGPDADKAFGTLAGSWIGGTGNMAAVQQMIGAGETDLGLAVLGDTTIYILWLPILLGCKKYAESFACFTGVDPGRVERMERIALEQAEEKRPPTTPDFLALLAVGLLVTWAATAIAAAIPEAPPYLSTSTYRILLVTTLGIGLSFSPMRRVPGSHELGMALVYLFVARMGASAQLDRLAGQALPFLAGATLWIFIHGAFCLLGAKLLKVDIHTAAIASAANIGGAASATVVASHHRESLVPAAVLMALVGYAVGNYAAYLAWYLCSLVG